MKVLKEAKRVFPQIQVAVLHMHPSHILSPLHRRSFYAEEEGLGGEGKASRWDAKEKDDETTKFPFSPEEGGIKR